MKSRASDVRVFFSERVDFPLYAARASRATIFPLHFHDFCVDIRGSQMELVPKAELSTAAVALPGRFRNVDREPHPSLSDAHAAQA